MSDGAPPPAPPGDAATLMSSLADSHPVRFSSLRRSVSAELQLQQHRLVSLLLSPPRFSIALSHLRSLSLAEKTTILARLLLRTLHHLATSADSRASPSPSRHLPLRDLDAAVLLMAMCDSYNTHGQEEESPPMPTSPRPLEEEEWRRLIATNMARNALSLAGLGSEATFEEGVELGAKCGRLLSAMDQEGRGVAEKEGREVAAAVAAVVGLEGVDGGGKGCAVCREEMEKGRDVCLMPCGHRFHWGCTLPWLRRRNTCPCCRYELPSDDVFCEIRRLWRVVAAAAAAARGGRGKAER